MRTKNKDKELNHRHFVAVRLTDVELNLLDQGATCFSISRSEYLRKLLLVVILSVIRAVVFTYEMVYIGKYLCRSYFNCKYL